MTDQPHLTIGQFCEALMEYPLDTRLCLPGQVEHRTIATPAGDQVIEVITFQPLKPQPIPWARVATEDEAFGNGSENLILIEKEAAGYGQLVVILPVRAIKLTANDTGTACGSSCTNLPPTSDT
ncbi:hypothetical protein [Deinococcus roseus]|uniref:Restriction endonuclease domain-containing protein n=1 Tax=Deinococcus roseus TaxID=392414 RepID=A0ABQ2DG07_9DEIO|nr:hypothetical protein [Deinococcus roseus]GGJ56475.1 hypothetical protein GCM10008938_48300 [Deinococcus roseus]